MSLTITRDTSDGGVKGVYSPNLLIVSDGDITYEYFKLYFHYTLDGATTNRVIKLYQNNDGAVKIDLNNLIKDAFESDVKTAPILLNYTFNVSTYLGIETHIWMSDTSSFVINGIKDKYDNYFTNELNDTIMLSEYGSKPLLLNDENNNAIYWSDDLYSDIGEDSVNELKLSWLSGVGYRGAGGIGTSSGVSKWTVTVYNIDGSTSYSHLHPLYVDRKIETMDIDPISLAVGVDDNTLYYTLQADEAEFEFSQLYTVNIVKPNMLNDKYFRLGWINKNGVNNYFNFDHNYSKSLSKKTLDYKSLDSNYSEYTKIYNTEAEETYNITTGWICEEDSVKLEGLWVSPSVKVSSFYTNSDDYFKDKLLDRLIIDEYVTLDVKNIEIKRRRNSKLINYSVSFTLGDKYRVQTH